MNTVLLERLLKDPSALEDASVADLESFATAHPWFGTSHYLLAMKKQQLNSSDAAEALQKAALYYHPLWFTHQVKNIGKVKQVNEAAYPPLQSTAKPTENISETISSKADEAELVFEPYYTVDYFASQGIKLKEDPNANDQLTQQVKSFTQWLRTMKKIYVEQEASNTPIAENEVIAKADDSNTKTDVITEAMAEVLIKQGKKEQAHDLYRKLSLLHPEKSHYFASLIDTLNKSS
ncbi:MAG: hypothetical protein FJX94_05700 [Bacteroidetes bacterium]|nr:hypothetical protein [Bacteroidota bacterium]